MSQTNHLTANAADCVVHAAAHILATEPALEAVTLDLEQRPVSIAVLGPESTDPTLSNRVFTCIDRARQSANHRRCGLLDGEADCQACGIPFAPFERQSIRITRDGNGATISRVTCPTAPRFWHWRKIKWPSLSPREIHLPEEPGEEIEEWKPQLAASVMCAALGIAGHFAGPGFTGQLLYIFAYLFGSWFAAKDVLELLGKGKLDVHFLMLAVALGSASIGAWGEGATLLFLFSFSSALEHFAMGRTQREIRSLFKAAPKSAVLLDESGNEREVPVETLQPGMRLLIRPGTQFPVDAALVQGTTAADESNLTGEATPVEKSTGDTVLAGTMNLWGAVEVTVSRPASESSLQQIIRLIREAQHLKAPAQRLTDRFGPHYTWAILSLSALMFLVWWLGFGLPAFTSSETQPSAFYRAMILLVVSSPCALVLSIPSAVLAAIASGARRGILFRGGAAVEKLAAIQITALDKTGTLTTGELKVERVESFPPGKEAFIEQLAFSLEKLSTHPIARAVTRHGIRHQIKPFPLAGFQSVAGQGVTAQLDGRPVLLGRREWVLATAQHRLAASAPPPDSGLAEVWVSGKGVLGRIILRDDIRPQAQSVLQQLRRAGLKTVVLTGDHKAAGNFLKTQLDVDEVRAELKPEDKVSMIEQWTRDGNRVAMVGDGVNDAPSLAAAHVGVAMGARGSDAALEQAEVVLMHDRLENFWSAFQLSRRARAIIRQNLVVSLGTVAVLVSFAMAGAIPLTIGVVGHEGSTVIVVFNSLRLLWSRDS